jgi:F-type H+-transporting ATPase subunit gamma
MQMVSAAKSTRSEQNAKNFQVYAQKVRAMTTDLIGSELSEGQIIQC